jgi:hypothetical protein
MGQLGANEGETRMRLNGRRVSETKFGANTRFNWGFHDGAADQRSGFVALWNRGPRPQHFDPIYFAGYSAGQDAVKAGESTELSTPAWVAWKGAK